jgi:integrase
MSSGGHFAVSPDKWLITYRGERIKRIDQSFVEAAKLACLDRRDIDGHDRIADRTMGWPTPHIMRHTRATLMLQAGCSYEEVGQYLGMTARMVETTYGHHHVAYQAKQAATA